MKTHLDSMCSALERQADMLENLAAKLADPLEAKLAAEDAQLLRDAHVALFTRSNAIRIASSDVAKWLKTQSDLEVACGRGNHAAQLFQWSDTLQRLGE